MSIYQYKGPNINTFLLCALTDAERKDKRVRGEEERNRSGADPAHLLKATWWLKHP